MNNKLNRDKGHPIKAQTQAQPQEQPQ